MTRFNRRHFLATCAAVVPAAAFAQGSEDARLHGLLDRMFEAQIDDSPEFATSLGRDQGARAAMKSQLDDHSVAAKARRLERDRAWLADLRGANRQSLSEAARIDLDSVLYMQERAVHGGDRYKFGDTGRNYNPFVISQRTGSYRGIPDFLDSQHKVETAADAEANLARLSAFARQMDQELERHKHDVALGAVPPAFSVPLAIGQLKALRDQPAGQTILVTSLAAKAEAAGLTGDWAARAERIVAGEVFPALDRQIAAMQALQGKAREDTGAWALPDGAAYYADAVKNSTTTDYTPDQVHAMGLEQVAEINGRIDAILKTQGMTQGTVAQRLAALNDDPQQLYPNTDAGRAQILADLNMQIRAIYKDLPKAFRTMPKAPVEVRRVPAFIQDGASNGYYQSPALDGSRPGAFYINLKNTAEWPRYNLPTLTYHEAAPGHHMQIAIAQENPAIPILRRTGFSNSAFSEGWGLYAEQVADEMDVYSNDPLGRVGYLQSLMFRAARLVVDTGIHAKRWTRDQATDYMVNTLGQQRSRLLREVERYFISPGQACSYKVGHTVWARVRERARQRMGARFATADFHDQGLLYGNMPMTVLERHIAAWAAKA